MRAFAFPGQGTDVIPLLRRWATDSVATRRLLDVAVGAAGISEDTLWAAGGRAMHRTEVLQPVLTALTLGIHEELTDRGVEPDVVLGHSLGEVAALAAAGVFTPDGAVELAAVRGQVMAREAESRPGTVVACEADEATVRRALRETGVRAEIAAYNHPHQVTVSGAAGELRRLAAVACTVPLPVAGAWHSAAMRGAASDVRREAILQASGRFRVRWVSNRDGRVWDSEADVPRLLAEQLTHPVQWVQSMHTLRERGVTEVLVLGSRPLRALTRACLDDSVSVRSITNPSVLPRRVGGGRA